MEGEFAMDNKVFLTIKETAEYLGVNRNVVYGLVRGNAKFPARKIGKSWFVHKANLDAWCSKVVK